MKKIMIFGAFDGFHPGHLNFFKQARKFGEYLIVSVGTDKNVAKIKNRKPLFGQEERMEMVRNCRLVDEAVLGSEKDFYEHIKAFKPDVVCLGYDQWADEKSVRGDLNRVGLSKTQVIRLKPHEASRAKSTIAKKRSVDF